MNANIIPVPVYFADNYPHNFFPELQNSFPDSVRDEKKRNIRLNHRSSPGHQEHPRARMTAICRSSPSGHFPMRPVSFLILHWIDSSNATNLSIPLHFSP